MKTTIFMSLFGAVAVMATSVADIIIPHPEDVWVPRITSPTATTIWHIGTVRRLFALNRPCRLTFVLNSL
jgi:hypothetical protein